MQQDNLKLVDRVRHVHVRPNPRLNTQSITRFQNSPPHIVQVLRSYRGNMDGWISWTPVAVSRHSPRLLFMGGVFIRWFDKIIIIETNEKLSKVVVTTNLFSLLPGFVSAMP